MRQSFGTQRGTQACESIREQVARYVSCDELAIPMLPDVAVKVVSMGTRKSANANWLAQLINADASLTMYVLRIAASAAKRPAKPIVSLQHAVAWLGMDEVANIAFTLALQGKLLDVKSQQRRARRLWRHSLASALWARQLAHMLARETGVSYLCALLHEIGKLVTLGAVNDVAERAGVQLTGADCERLIEDFHRDVGRRVTGSWALPEPVAAVAASWENYQQAGAHEWESNVVNVAHKLADFSLNEASKLPRDSLTADAAFRHLGFDARDGEPLFESIASINAELDRYLSP